MTQNNLESLKEPMFNLSLKQIKICLEEKIDLNSLFLLEALEEEKDLAEYLKTPQLDSWKQTLVRKSLINEKGILLTRGKALLDNIRKGINCKKEKLDKNVSNEETSFDIWWRHYPGTNNFEINGKRFKGTRTFRVEKDTCRLLYNAILTSGDYSHEEMIEAIKLETENRKEESYRTGEDKLKYLQNSATYLRQYSFDPYIELVRTGLKSQNSNQKTTETDYIGGINI
jgi:hypothetical protein